MLLNKLPPRLDFVAHEDAEQVVGGGGVVHGDLQQGAVGGVEGGVAEFFGVHFAEAFEAGDLQALLAGGAYGGQQAAEVVEPGLVVAAGPRFTVDGTSYYYVPIVNPYGYGSEYQTTFGAFSETADFLYVYNAWTDDVTVIDTASVAQSSPSHTSSLPVQGESTPLSHTE